MGSGCVHDSRIVRPHRVRGSNGVWPTCRNRENFFPITEGAGRDFHILCGKRGCNPEEFLPAQATWVRADFWWQVPALTRQLTGVAGLVPAGGQTQSLPSVPGPAKLEST